MKKRYLFIPVAAIVGLILFSSMQHGKAYSIESPFGNTGSPGDGSNNTCAKSGCHDNSAVNSGTGSINIDLSDIPSSGFAPGQTYDITVSVSESGSTNFGFQLTAEDKSDQSKVGTLMTGGNTKVAVIGPGTSKNWISHRTVSGTGNWTFQWTAPSGVQTVEFYATGNAANGNGGRGGDKVYQTSASANVDPLSGISEAENSFGFRLLGNPISNELRFETTQQIELNLYNASGKRMKVIRTENGLNDVNVSELPAGIYILSEASGEIAVRLIKK